MGIHILHVCIFYWTRPVAVREPMLLLMKTIQKGDGAYIKSKHLVVTECQRARRMLGALRTYRTDCSHLSGSQTACSHLSGSKLTETWTSRPVDDTFASQPQGTS